MNNYTPISKKQQQRKNYHSRFSHSAKMQLQKLPHLGQRMQKQIQSQLIRNPFLRYFQPYFNNQQQYQQTQQVEQEIDDLSMNDFFVGTLTIKQMIIKRQKNMDIQSQQDTANQPLQQQIQIEKIQISFNNKKNRQSLLVSKNYNKKLSRQKQLHSFLQEQQQQFNKKDNQE